jgi:hypothetical protein
LQFAICNLQCFVLACSVCLAAPFATVQAAEPELLERELLDVGWIKLFDGQTLYGWKPTGEAEWEVADGEVRTAGDKPGFLTSSTRFADFQLTLQFKAPADSNSGVFLRAPRTPTDPKTDCYELNIAPRENPFPTGSLVGRKKADRLLREPKDLLGKGIPLEAWDGKWHTINIWADGGEFVVLLDHQLVLEYEDTAPIRIGHILLQSREGPVAFRNIRLRPLGFEPLFNGHNLVGWSSERAERSRFEVTDEGELQVLDGPGQIETERELANFVLQLDCKINGDGLNSGVFFRTLTEGRWAGYESQLNNVFRDGDRTKPADFGTGGIYRRHPARRVVADDHEWFTKTIVADGPHMAVWVEGYQVSDWTDERPPRDNAREGFRAGPGVIAIQGHDPSTNLLFRHIRAAELPE